MRILILLIMCILIYSMTNSDLTITESLNNAYFQEDSLLQWSDSVRLNWDDFRKNPALATKHLNHDAVTNIYIKYFNWTRYNDSLVFDFICYFNKNASWTKKKTESLLIHEQGHFDIAEIYSRKIRKELTKYTPLNYNDAVRRFNSVKDSLFEMLKETHGLYDLETNYSRDLGNQKLWNSWIDSSLISLDNWKNTKVIMRW